MKLLKTSLSVVLRLMIAACQWGAENSATEAAAGDTPNPIVQPNPTPGNRVQVPTPTPAPTPPIITGWLDPMSLIVTSDGTCSLGSPGVGEFNASRDQGSKIVYFDTQRGDNLTAEAYWWNGTQIVDSHCSPINPVNGLAYGNDPLNPNPDAVMTFAQFVSANDDRLRTQAGPGGPNFWRFEGVAGGYPDWFLFRRGQTHTEFDRLLAGGRSEREPMVISAYGPLQDGRAIIAPGDEESRNPFSGHNWGLSPNWFHQAIFSLEIRARYGYLGTHIADSFAGGPVTAYLEDCYWPSQNQGHIVYAPAKTTFRRSIFANSWLEGAHNQAFYSSDYKNQVTMDEVIMYKNGYKTNPMINADPRRDIFSRNIYQGGGAKMGYTYRNIISADGASGGPQMRLGGLMENSLVIEGYFFSATNSNAAENPWLTADGQVGQSAVVRNNVQLVFRYPTSADPDTDGASDARAQPAWGYTAQGATFGAVIEGNIITGAMLRDDLHGEPTFGIHHVFSNEQYDNGQFYAPRNNTIRNNILYRMRDGLSLTGDASAVIGVVFENNIAVADRPMEATLTGVNATGQVHVRNNRFYSSGALPTGAYMGSGNTVAAASSAAATEGWTDPDRTMKRYVQEVLGLTLLDWSDDPFLDRNQAQLRATAGEAYDPMGLKTFMAVAVHMRKGGTVAIPSSGKPSLRADYPWDERFAAVAVVNWIRAGFNLPAVP